MALSMTAFASLDIALPGAIAHWEIRSINHRFLELSFKLPELIREIEYPLRESIRKFISRGKVECSLKLEVLNEQGANIKINEPLLQQLITASKVVMERLPLNTTVSLFDFLKWPAVIKTDEASFHEFSDPLQQSFLLAVKELVKAREREGEKLKIFIMERINKINHILKEIIKRLPEFQAIYRQKLSDKLSEFQSLEEPRFEQEFAYLIQKMDISEEVDRLNTHIQETERILNAEKIMGRRLDFLMQELNREANTIASKAMDKMIIREAIDLKVLIEEMREQIQNIE